MRSRVEAYSFLKRIGDVRGQKVVDIACGAGDYTRVLRRAGAAPVVGFDVSEKMIALARESEAREPLGIEYFVADARATSRRQDFDLGVAAYLLVHARNRDELATMCRGIACWIRPGGRFVTLTTNPALYAFAPLPDYRKYGFQIRLDENAYDGAPIELTAFLGDGSLVIQNYYLPIEAYEEAFRDAGFCDVAIHMPELSPGSESADERDYWDDYLTFPPAVVIECVRS